MSDVAENPIDQGQVTDAEVTNQDPALEQQQPETQEPQAQDDKSEPSEAEKEFRRMQRRLEKAQRNNYKLHAELEQLRSQPRQEQTEHEQPTEDRIRQEAKRMVEIERINARCDDIVAEGVKKFKGFDNSVKAIQEEAPLFDQRGAPTALLEAVLDADKPAELLHYLGSNPDLAAELADLSPVRQAKRIGQIELEMREAKKPSGAPKPLEPVKQASSVKKSPAEMSDAEYAKWRKSGR